MTTATETPICQWGEPGLLALVGIDATTIVEALKIPGRSEAEDNRRQALAEITRRIAAGTLKTQELRITSPRAASEYLLGRSAGWTEERFGLIALNCRGIVIADEILSQGTATSCVISPREFFMSALRHGASSAIAWHNHPSGDPTPSREDIQLTKRLRTAGESLGVPLADHIIVGGTECYSFRVEEGWDA